MFNFNIDWSKQVRDNIPYYAVVTDFVMSLVKPFKVIYDEFRVFSNRMFIRVSYTGQVIYLEKLLNDEHDTNLRRIYISAAVPYQKPYYYRRVENKPARYIYLRWNPLTAYAVGDFAQLGTKVYRVVTANTNKQPDVNSEWVFHANALVIRQHIEYLSTIKFVLNVPTALQPNITQIRALVDSYRFATLYYSVNYI